MNRYRRAVAPCTPLTAHPVGLLLGLGLLLGVVVAAAGQGARGPGTVRGGVRFNRDVRPILAENCFQCHGPDRNKLQANLRLDVRDQAVARGVLAPGKPDQSRLLARILAPDPARRMPPPRSHKQLSLRDKQVLRQWIAEGARYERHWAFVPLPAAFNLPPVRNGKWARSDLDRFVLARLEQAGLAPSPEAGKAEWLRRVTLDLHGLLPEPTEVDAFLDDLRPDAYERVVDRLLSSPRYGERMAVPWLDLARYADSYGYQSDQLSPTWPYRDWVIRAFNSNLPYDQFLTWQIAGDLLPNATREQRLATAFNRLHRMTNEGGSVPEEWRLEAVADRVNTLGAASLGLTLECARCHDHKYDPISQREYYSLSAFFNSIDEHGLYDRADIVPSPSLLLPTPEQEAALTSARAAVAAATERLHQVRRDREPAFQQWLRSAPRPVLTDETGRFDCEEFQGEVLPNQLPGAREHGKRADEVPLVSGRRGRAARFDGENNLNFPNLGRFHRSTPFTISFWLRDPGRPAEPAVVFQACSGTDTGPHGYDLIVEQGRLSARLFRHWPGNAIGIQTRGTVPRGEWTHIAVTYDGSSRAAGLRIYLNGAPAESSVLRDHLVKDTRQHVLTFGQRFRDRGLVGGEVDDIRLFARALTPLEASELAGRDGLRVALAAVDAGRPGLREYYLSAGDPEARKAAAELQAARQRWVAAEDVVYEIAVMEEMPEPRPAYVLPRGRYDAPRTAANRVERDALTDVLPFPPDLPRTRLGLARWLTHPGHPLTARVAVNRLWALCFGQGLVETQENFGIQGRPPSHPALLDWLARSFITGGWDTHRLLKTIVLSATYRQSSSLRPELAARDPRNLLLARGPSHRLSAEAIRDIALQAAGLLDPRLGGAPVSPYQPGDLWRESNSMSPAYRQSVGGDLYRRSLYTVWKRTTPMPNMMLFDAVSREVCVARRQMTSTPLQALVLLNDPQFVEAARLVGERALKEAPGAPARQVRLAFRRLATREPTPQEARLLESLYASQKALFEREPDAAARLLRGGDRRSDPTLPPADAAAATAVAQAILNLDATIWKR